MKVRLIARHALTNAVCDRLQCALRKATRRGDAQAVAAPFVTFPRLAQEIRKFSQMY